MILNKPKHADLLFFSLRPCLHILYQFHFLSDIIQLFKNRTNLFYGGYYELFI